MNNTVNLARRRIVVAAGGAAALGTAALRPAFAQANDFKIGFFIALSGPAALFGPTQRACADLAAERINKAGGILGRPVRLIFTDAGGPPAETAKSAVRLMSGAVAAGEALCIVGRNGVGKSTLLKLLFGQLPCRAGSIRFEGRDVQAFEATARRSLGISYCPQERPVFDDLSVRDNLTLMRPDRRVDAFEPLFARFPVLGRRLAQHAGTLSGGEKKMLSFVRGFAEAQPLLLVDEPSEGVQWENIVHMDGCRRPEAAPAVFAERADQHGQNEAGVQLVGSLFGWNGRAVGDPHEAILNDPSREASDDDGECQSAPARQSMLRQPARQRRHAEHHHGCAQEALLPGEDEQSPRFGKRLADKSPHRLDQRLHQSERRGQREQDPQDLDPRAVTLERDACHGQEAALARFLRSAGHRRCPLQGDGV